VVSRVQQLGRNTLLPFLNNIARRWPSLAAQNPKDILDIDIPDDIVGKFGVDVMRKYVQKPKLLECICSTKTTLVSQSAAREEVAREVVER